VPINRSATRRRLGAVLHGGATWLFLGLAFSLTLLLARSLVVQSDEGYTLNAAWQVWNGMKMYDDFRQFVGPGCGYLIYLLWTLIGSPSYLAARLLSLVFSFSSTTAVVLVLRRAGVRGINLAFSVIAWVTASSLCMLLNHNSFSSFAATWFLLSFLRIARRPAEGADHQRQRLDHALVGVSAGIVFLFLQTKGLFLALGAVAFAFSVGFKRRDYRPGLALAGGFIAVIAPLFLIWSPALLIRQWFVIPLTGNYLGHTGASGAIAFTSVALTCGMGWMAIRWGDPVLKALAVTQAALVACMAHNMEYRHLAINSFPAIIFVSLVIHRRVNREGGEEKLSSEMTMGIVVAMVVATMLATPAGKIFSASSTFYVDLLGRRSRLALFSNRRLAEAHAIYAGPFLPGLYFELKKKNPFFVSETIVCNGECQERLIAELAVARPELVLLQYEMVRHLSYDQNNPVDVYLRQRYLRCRGDYADDVIVRARDASWCP
jgi:hypothetical protein